MFRGKVASWRRLSLMMSTEESATRRPWGKRLGWLVFLWLVGVCALGLVALLLKFVMRLAGLTA